MATKPKNKTKNYLIGLTGTNMAADKVATLEMTAPQVATMKTKLRSQNRLNVFPNQFDAVNEKFRVAMNFDNTWLKFGNFANIEVATAVGAIVSKAYFGDEALQGSFDAEVAGEHEELEAWMTDERNAEVVARYTSGKSHLDEKRQDTMTETADAVGDVVSDLDDDIPF